jgi:hypothetical protein
VRSDTPFNVDDADRLYFDAYKALQEAEAKYKAQEWQNVIGSAQLCIELSVKGILELFDIEYPPDHDVSAKLASVPRKVTGLSEYDVQSIATTATATFTIVKWQILTFRVFMTSLELFICAKIFTL